MNTSVIRHRVADFLKQHAPFDALPETDLLEVAGSGRVKFHESEELVYRSGDAKGKFVWMIQQGTVHLLQGDPELGKLHDVLDAGDLLGLDFYSTGGPCLYTARTATDVLLYVIDGSLFERLVAKHPAFEQYLSAQFAVASPGVPSRQSWLDAEPPPEDFLRARFLRGGVAALDVSSAVAVGAGISTRDAVREMLRWRTEKLALTPDGSPSSPPFAVLSASDLALFCGQNPARLRREILDSESPVEIRALVDLSSRMVLSALAQPSDVDDCARMGSAMVATTVETCIRLSREDKISARGWLAFGKLARGEMMRPSSPMIAVVLDDAHPAGERVAAADRCAAWLEACGLGSGTHPGVSLNEWKRFYIETATDPLAHDLFARREFFDVSVLAGDRGILDQLSVSLAAALKQDSLLVPLLANDTLAHLPPLTFYRGLVVDFDGGERESLDLASTALEPISDAARVFALGQRSLSVASTLERLEAAASLMPQHERVLREAADAFRIALYHQSMAGMPIINPASLSRYDQRLLKTAFSSILSLLELTRSTYITEA